MLKFVVIHPYEHSPILTWCNIMEPLKFFFFNSIYTG